MDWKTFFKEQEEYIYFSKLKEKVAKERENYNVYPPIDKVFSAFDLTSFENVKVVIMGQDPYHGPNQAMGLSFSVPDGIKIPPSLKNIFKEIEDDLGIKCFDSGDLTRWARQGAFLLNTVLTVREHQPNSHESFGWKNFTANVISSLDKNDIPKVFVLWGKNAQSLRGMITNKKHLILEASHPSPLSAYRGFFGCKHFSKINNFLEYNGRTPIDWR